LKLFDFDKLVASLTGLIETKVELIKLDIETEVKKVVARGVIFIFIGLAISMAVFLLSIGLASFLNHLLSNEYLGYGLVALVYLIFALVAYTQRDKIYHAVIQNLNKLNESNDEE